MSIHDYGFRWGPLNVTRLIEYRGVRVLNLKTEHRDLEVRISPTGRRVRVWSEGKEFS